MTPTSKILLAIIVVMLIIGAIDWILPLLRDKMRVRKRQKVKRICRERAEEAYRLAYRKLNDWETEHPHFSEINSEYRELVDDLLRTFRKTLRYRPTTSRDEAEIERLEEILSFR